MAEKKKVTKTSTKKVTKKTTKIAPKKAVKKKVVKRPVALKTESLTDKTAKVLSSAAEQVVNPKVPETKIAKEALDQAVLRWSAPDYYTFDKSPFWSLGVGVLAIVFSLILIYTNNYFPVIIIILAVIVTFQVSHDKPKGQEFAIDDGGMLERNRYVPYRELKSFWITKHENKPILYLEPFGLFKSPIVIPLAKQSKSEVRILLLHHLPEKFEAGELFSDKLMRLFRL